jgi:hypothetical protein
MVGFACSMARRNLIDMLRIEAVCVCALFVGAAIPLGAQDRPYEEERDGPQPIDSTQSISAGADDDIRKRPNESSGQSAGTPGHASGSYAGVVPGAAKQPPAAKAAKASSGPTITWPGFQMRPDGSSRVFIQSTAPLEPKVLSAAGTKFELELPRARIAAKTNRLPLDTRFFNTPVTRVSVSSASAGAVVHVDLRAPVTPLVSSEPGPTGYFFTYIELPKGDYLARPGAPVNAAAPVDTAPPAHPSKVLGKANGSASAAATSDEASGSVKGEAAARGGIKIGR